MAMLQKQGQANEVWLKVKYESLLTAQQDRHLFEIDKQQSLMRTQQQEHITELANQQKEGEANEVWLTAKYEGLLMEQQEQHQYELNQKQNQT